MMTRREFLRAAAIGAASAAAADPISALARDPLVQFPRLSDRFADPRRHFVFEYYPWYRTAPYAHWGQWDRRPPVDLASNYMPRLGAYDSGSTAVLEQHARWIAETGAGAVNVSWWGPGSPEDQLVPRLMDVMAAHDLHVAFHVEPYSATHALDYARDIQYLITEYGDRRRWDCFLLLENANGDQAPVFKSFATILPQQSTDCHGLTTPVSGYTADDTWRRQTDRVRDFFRRDFDRLTLLADSLAFDRVRAGGFDGIAIYDNYVHPDTWVGYAQGCTARDLLFSFNTNPGFDSIAQRSVEPGSCYKPPAFDPPGDAYDWSQPLERQRAARACSTRIRNSFRTSVMLQTAPTLTNSRRGFFLTYINSFNEWHEGHQFEPMKDARELTSDERAVGYHNPDDGGYRLAALTDLLEDVLD
jgi:Glycosyl hydrolase family 99